MTASRSDRDGRGVETEDGVRHRKGGLGSGSGPLVVLQGGRGGRRRNVLILNRQPPVATGLDCYYLLRVSVQPCHRCRWRYSRTVLRQRLLEWRVVPSSSTIR